MTENMEHGSSHLFATCVALRRHTSTNSRPSACLETLKPPIASPIPGFLSNRGVFGHTYGKHQPRNSDNPNLAFDNCLDRMPRMPRMSRMQTTLPCYAAGGREHNPRTHAPETENTRHMILGSSLCPGNSCKSLQALGANI